MLAAFIKWSKDQQRPIKYVLSDIYGLGNSKSIQTLQSFGIQNHYRFGRLNMELQKQITQQITNEELDTYVPIENDAKDTTRYAIQELKDIRSYRGVRHLLHLPVRGQRSKTNCRTQKSHKPKAAGQRTSYRFKSTESKASHKKTVVEASAYVKTVKKRARGRHCLQT